MKIIYTITLLFLPLLGFSQSTKQQELNRMLSEIRKPIGESVNPFLFDIQNFDNNVVKHRVLDLLMNKWNEDEINSWVDSRININGYKSYREVNAEKISKSKKMPYERALDSIKATQVNEIRKFVESKPVSNKIVLLVAWLNMKEAIPVLVDALKKPVHYNKEVVELSLARLNVEPYHSDCVRRYGGKKRINDDALSDFFLKAYRLLYIGSAESINTVIKNWLYRDDKVQPYADDPLTIPIANYLVFELTDFIVNTDFRENYPEGFFVSPASVKKEQLNSIRSWIKQNKIEMNPNYFNLYPSGIEGL